MSRSSLVLLLAGLILSGSLMAAETKVNGRLYAHWSYDMTDGADGMNEFGLDRSYVTVRSRLSDFTTVRLTSDLRESTIEDNGKVKTRYYIILKYGYLDWKPAFAKSVLKLRFGLQPTPYIDFQNKLWGRRYMVKTVGDRNKFLTTSDLGAFAYVSLGEKKKYGQAGVGLFNGTSYSSLGEANKQKDINVFVRINPLANSEDLKGSAIVGQYYKGTQNMAFDDSTKARDYKNDIFSVGALLALDELFRIGADMNWQTLGAGALLDEVKRMGSSVHATLFLGELTEDAQIFRTLNLFGRYDIFDPDTDIDNDREKLMIVGVECNPTKGFKASLNITSTRFDDDRATEKQLNFNTLFKF